MISNFCLVRFSFPATASFCNKMNKIDIKHSPQALTRVWKPLHRPEKSEEHMNLTVYQQYIATYSQRDNLSPTFKNSGLGSSVHQLILKNLGYLALSSARIHHGSPWRCKMLDMFRLFNDILRDRVSVKIQRPAYL